MKLYRIIKFLNSQFSQKSLHLAKYYVCMNKYQTCFRDVDKMMKIEENEKYLEHKK